MSSDFAEFHLRDFARFFYDFLSCLCFWVEVAFYRLQWRINYRISVESWTDRFVTLGVEATWYLLIGEERKKSTNRSMCSLSASKMMSEEYYVTTFYSLLLCYSLNSNVSNSYKERQNWISKREIVHFPLQLILPFCILLDVTYKSIKWVCKWLMPIGRK